MRRHDALNDVQIGDIVYLRSGSPAMTVTAVEVGEDETQEWVHLAWFVNGELHTEEDISTDALTASSRSDGFRSS